MSELPTGWTRVRVRDVIEPADRVRADDDTQVGFIPMARLGKGYREGHTYERRSWSQVKKGYVTFRDGDVLLARITPCFENGKAAVVSGLPGGLGAGSTEFFVHRSKPELLLPEFLFAHFKTREFLAAGEQVMSGAVGQQRVPRDYVLESEFPLPPLTEQRRIADKLDELLAKVDACRERLDRIPSILKRFRQSVLAAATSGELTRDWRRSRSSESAWATRTIQDLAEAVFDGPFGSNLKTKDYVPSGVRVVRLENIGHLEFRGDAETFVSEEKFQALRRHELRAGDVVVSSFVDEEVRVCLIPKALDGCAINKADCFCVRVDPSACLPEFLVLVLASRDTFLGLEGLVHGATRPRVNLGQLRSLEIRIPSLEEQEEICRRVSAMFEVLARVERRRADAVVKVALMTPSILAKAFRGELVPQDPNDEPASELLERIRRSSASTPKSASPKPRQGRRKAERLPSPLRAGSDGA